MLRTATLAALITIGLGVVGFAAIGHAASASFSSGGIGMASVALPRCTTAGLTVVPTLSGANVVSVAVGALPAGCGSATLQATVVAGAASGSGSATIPAGGGSVTVTLGTAVAAAASARVDLVIIGP